MDPALYWVRRNHHGPHALRHGRHDLRVRRRRHASGPKYTIDPIRKLAYRAGTTEAVLMICGGWLFDVDSGRAVLMSPAMDRLLAGAWQTRDVSSLVA
jgi:hypothetical protein